MHDIIWPRLIKGTLIKRYQRFKADVKLRNGHVVTALCPNTGSMKTCSKPGMPVFLSRHNKSTRKLKYTWEMIEMPTSLVGINTMIPNILVKTSIRLGKIKELTGYASIRSEVEYGRNSRIDLLLERSDEKCFVEVKNCTQVEGKIAYFPDAVTTRGLKHLVELDREIQGGNRAIMFYLVQRMDAKGFSPAHHIDAAYGRELKRGFGRGIEVLVYDVSIDLEGISIRRPLPFEI